MYHLAWTNGRISTIMRSQVKDTHSADGLASRPTCNGAASLIGGLQLNVKIMQPSSEQSSVLGVSVAKVDEVPHAYLTATGLQAVQDRQNPYASLLEQLNGFMKADEQDKLESDENQTEIEEGKDVESIKEEVKEADDVAKDEQLVKTPFLQEAQEDAQLTEAQSSIGLAEQSVPESTSLEFNVQIIHDIREANQQEWDSTAVSSEGLNPFVLHGFLAALESSYSAVKETGWTPHHLLVRNSLTNALVGCCPMYLKRHSQGEYIFDHSWAGVAMRLGMAYYPKLQCCVPFSPVGGPRFMIKLGEDVQAITAAMAKSVIEITDQFGISSTHITFNNSAEWGELADLGFLQRTGVQYHWENKGYTNFDGFLASLKQSKRKNIRQERKFVHNSGLKLRRLSGLDLKPSHWDNFYQFYMNTCSNKWGRPYLTRDFFHELGCSMADHVMLAVAQEGDEKSPLVAAALNLVGSEAIYGRNWGCAYDCNVKHLHFELCYYQAQEFAIERGLKRVEAGAQGEHKLQRGYLPSRTYSSHYIRDALLRSIIERHLNSERESIEYTLEQLTAIYSPYKSTPVAPLAMP